MGAKPRAFKHQLGAERVRAIASAIASASPRFDAPRFVASAQRGLAGLELKARVRHVIACLHAALPQPFPVAVAVILAAVERDGQRHSGDERVLRVKRCLQRMSSLSYQLLNLIAWCSPLGPVFVKLRRAQGSGKGQLPAQATMKRLEDGGIHTVEELRELRHFPFCPAPLRIGAALPHRRR